MRSSFLKTTFIWCSAGLVSASFLKERTAAAVLFSENFDNSPPYSNEGAIPLGYGVINYGSWFSVEEAGGSSVRTVTSKSVSGSRSVQLLRGATGNGTLRGDFGTSNLSTSPVTDALEIKFAFQTTNVSANAYFYLRNSNGQNLAYVFLGRKGYVQAEGLPSPNVSSIVSNTWYQLVITLPALPSAGNNQYTVSLFNGNGDLLGSDSAAFSTQTPSSFNYSYFGIVTGSTAGESLFIDNLTIRTIPEPESLSLASLAGCGIAVRAFRRKRR